jgi:hydrogenase maturation protein HypF
VSAVEIRVRGRVQGVGFRPTVWRLARELGLDGTVANDCDGVLIRAAGPPPLLEAFLERLAREPPPLARVESVRTDAFEGALAAGFHIVGSSGGAVRTEVAPDARVCDACAREVVDPFARRFRYPFTTCTHCGPRLSLVTGVPYDRARTTLAPFDLCAECAAEYGDPADRRFHAETTACHRCGPRARLVRLDGSALSFEQHSMLDDVDAAASLIKKGEIVALKGLGGFHLACDATRAEVVQRLRQRKQRDRKPFALMARDLDVIRRYAEVTPLDEAVLRSPAAPIVLLPAAGAPLPAEVAPGLTTLGFMLPTTPLHLLVLRGFDRPLVMTSANLSDEPQVTGDDEARRRLVAIAPYALLHDRDIANRVDDSVVRVVDGAPRVLRRARGYAPAPVALPPGFDRSPPILAYGGELKGTFCLVRDGHAVLSQHQGDLDHPATFDDYRKSLELYAALFEHAPAALASDRHPDYASTRLARVRAREEGLPLVEVQHHHAHVAACLAEHGRPLDAPPVLGVVLDGIGLGDDGAAWGGEFLVADYRAYRRAGTLKPVALLGGDAAAREPWRNLYAHLLAEQGWPALSLNFGALPVLERLAAKPRALLDGMLRSGTAAPLASSCGRLFDAFAALVDLAFERQAYEGEAAMRLEALACPRALVEEDEALAYPFTIPRLGGTGLRYLEPLAMWNAALGDLTIDTPPAVMAARFHRGLAKGIAAMAKKLTAAAEPRIDTVALGGGCFANRILLSEVARRLRDDGLTVLAPAAIPCGDGGLALGQAAVAAAQLIDPNPRRGDR